MSKQGKRAARKPATKYSQLRKKMQKNKAAKRPGKNK